MKARVLLDVLPKAGILDPQGETIERNLPTLGFDGVSEVRVGKHIELVVEGADRDEIAKRLEEMAERFLTNPVIEDYTYRIEADE